MKGCEAILEDMLSWDKLLPDDMKRKVEEKFNDLGDKMETDRPPQFDETAGRDEKREVDDPPGEGPILRWQTRAVFAPGGDPWHPKNRKVKVSVTVKELGLSKHQFRRLRELA
ncbi:hypothetical protein L3X38_023391 [Prunus dulcis]|uniref:Uncharacterized protein n=1 Tax=Prunus dulcis TaxID=3755 RepID=A0AAD4Z5A1_PRUDU|nr:hypothetical protein L3X38_023391 [Prunus dulcis]